jgi:dTDP-glucose 4,6-dehydratase
VIFITGGAGFIGGNFVLDWLKDPKAEGIINLDKLTYAGNLATLIPSRAIPVMFLCMVILVIKSSLLNY